MQREHFHLIIATWVSQSISSLNQGPIMPYNIISHSGSLLFHSPLTQKRMFDHSSVFLMGIHFFFFFTDCTCIVLLHTYWTWGQRSWLQFLLLWLAGSMRVQSHRVLGWTVPLGCYLSLFHSQDSWRPSAGPPVPRTLRSAAGHTAK